ncbi:fatty acid synthase [Centruroides vittatus]|uniref:fatty acid synthase n=1 Tax=Centruroides vittatus TaxID=120091 RepID=UPI00350F4578
MPAQSETTTLYPSETTVKTYKMPKWDVTENIVISGMAGKFPESDNMNELWDNLMNKVDMVTADERRWEMGLYGLPSRLGKLKDLTRFDSTFFGVHPKQAQFMDPQLRMLLEVTYEAIVDAGYDPDELRNSRTGVFVGVCSSESNDFFAGDISEVNGYALTGCSFSMFANRISFTFNFKGPSFAMDTACSSSLFAMQQAVLAIRSNQCDAAVVAGCNICIRPATSLHFFKLNMLSVDGTCKAFDASANGYCRSETIGVAFLQRESKARRMYAIVSHVKTNTDGSKSEGITFPSESVQTELMKAVYEESEIDPLKVCYVEAHGTGTKAGDPVEIAAISNIFCKGRECPLLIGSVKASIGHAEPASGVGALAKLTMALDNGIIPPNIHYSTPNPDIVSLVEGRVKVVTEPTPLDTEYVALNSFGFGGVNVHVLLRANPRLPKYEEIKLPQLVLCCDRAEGGVSSLLNYLENTKVPFETYGFIQNLSKRTSMMYRGFTLLKEGPQKVASEIKKISSEKRPVWFIFSGMGTQWPGMGKDLLKLKPFAKSIQHSEEILKPFGIDLMQILTKPAAESSNKREIISSFVAIAAIQVALVDTLRELGVTPDGIVGHSVGELGCAYADGCFTAEQMILSAYWRGRCVEEANLIAGSMAAVGLTWEETKKRCPEGVLPACHNSEDTITVSGPTDKIAAFVKQMQAENIFIREVDSCGYAFHSCYINPAAPGLQRALEKIIPNPKPRTQRWISSSIPESNWDTPVAKLCSAAYLVNNLVSPVLFREALAHVPANAIVIEIAPHCLLQAILKRSLNANCAFIGLMNKKEKDNLDYFLSSVGKMYTAGINPTIEKFYPEVNYPVSRGVPKLSPFIQWDHSQEWRTALWKDRPERSAGEFVTEIDISNPESPDYFMIGHCIDKRVLFPATGYLVLAWKALAKRKNQLISQTAVEIENYSILRATILSKTGKTKFTVNIMDVTGEFEVCESGTVAASGIIRLLDQPLNIDDERLTTDIDKTTNIVLDKKDVYKELRLRGYDYGPTFQGIIESQSNGEKARLNWSENWEVFLDNMLQVSILSEARRVLVLPTRIQSIKIDPKYHQNTITEEGIPLVYDKYVNECIAGGVILKGLKASLAPRRQDVQNPPLLEEYRFIPNNETCILSKHEKNEIEQYIEVCSALSKKILEASGKNKAQISDVMNGFKEASDKVLKDYLSLTKESFIVLNSLKEISELPVNKSFQENLNNIVKQLQLSIANDIVSTTMLSEKVLRTALDITVENLLTRKLKVLEVSSSSQFISKKVQSYLLNFNVLLNVDYTITCPSSDQTEEGSKIITWDLESTPPNEFSNFDLVIAKDVCGKYNFQQLLENMTSFLRSGGFVLLIQRTDLTPAEKFLSAVGGLTLSLKSQEEIENALKTAGLSVICKKFDGIASKLYLARKNDSLKDVNTHSIIKIVDQKYDWVENLKETLYKQESESPVWLVAEDSNTNGIVGLMNCLRQEMGGERLRCIFNASKQKLPPFSFNDSVYKDLPQKDLAMNIYRDGQWGSFRHTSFQTEQSIMAEHAFVNVITRGDLSSLRWFESPLNYWKEELRSSLKEKVCHVYYASLNFRDIMLATGKLPPDAIPGDLATQDCLLGFEFSGRDSRGNRIMGLSESKGLATTVLMDSAFIWSVPEHWTLEEAGSVPVVYSTAYYALVVRGNIKKGESILIHSGSGGVGQAAISIALGYGCEVYTTVGSVEKKNFLKQRFPQLKDHNFSNSRDLSFEKHIMTVTKGKGVDLVLNSLAEEKLQASVRCLAQHGRFLEIGKYDLSKNSELGMAVFLKNISFHGILLDILMAENLTPATFEHKMQVVSLVNEGIKSGVVQPLKTTVFDQTKVEDAFRFMASGRHIGKVVIKVRDEERQSVIVPKPMKMPVLPRTTCYPNKVYIICGGLGGFGLELAAWLIIRGAKHILLTSRSGVQSGYQQYRIKVWKEQGVNIIISSLDASKYSQATELLELANKHGPVGGIFNLAMVLRDAMLENQNEENFIKVTQPKVLGTYNLDKASRKLCPKLNWFVVFSSVSCGRGNAGQSNYGYANSVMERICEERNKDGLPGLAIQWGAIGDVGVVLETMGGNDLVIGGTLPQRINSCLITLDTFLQQKYPVVASMVPAERKVKKQGNKQNLLQSISHILGIQDPNTLDSAITLGELGMDSLMGVEVKQTLERDYEINLSMQEIRSLSLKKLQELGGQESNVFKDDSSKVEKRTSDVIYKNWKLLMPKEIIVNMNNKTEGTPLIIIHSIEGVVTDLMSVTQELSCPVYGFQCTTDVPQSSCQDTANYYLDLIKTKIQSKGPYFILGYSFGTAIAFEIAIRLQQNKDKVQKLFFLDGSPALVTSYTKKHESRLNDDSMKFAEAMYSFIQQYVRVSDKLKLIQQLINLPSHKERLQYTVEVMTSLSEFKDSEDVAKAADSYYKKLLCANNYKCTGKFKGNAILIKASEGLFITSEIGEELGVRKFIDGNLNVHTVKGNHITFLKNQSGSKVASIINEEMNKQ